MPDNEPQSTGTSTPEAAQATSDANEDAGRAIISRLVESLFTIATLFLALSTVWFLVGSLWFPLWWYDALFRGDLFDRSYVLYGIHYLENYQSGLIVLLAIVAIVCIVLAQWRHSLLTRIFRPKRSLIVATSFGVIILVAAILNYREHGERYVRWRTFDTQQSLAYSNALLDSVIEVTGENQAPREITPPIVFRYLDGSALEGLYGEIEPALVEEERKVSTESSKKLDGSVKIGVESVASAEGSASSDSKQKLSSSFKKTSGSPERRALELINYCLKSHRLTYYSTSDAWYLDVSVREARQKLNTYANSKPANDAPKEPTGDSPNPEDSKGPSDEAKTKQERWNQQLYEEFENLNGLVLVDGNFDVVKTDKGINITRRFASSPHRISFKADLPQQADSDSWKSGARLRVLASVLRPLGKDGTVWLHPIAVF